MGNNIITGNNQRLKEWFQVNFVFFRSARFTYFTPLTSITCITCVKSGPKAPEPEMACMWRHHFLESKTKESLIYVVGRLGGLYREKLWLRCWKCCRGRRPRAAFSSPRSQFFPIWTDPKLDNNIFIFFSCGKLAYGRTSGFVYQTLSLNWLYAPFANKQNQQANQRVFTKQRKVYQKTELFRTTLC